MVGFNRRNVERWFFREEAICGQCGGHVDQEPLYRPVPGMFELADVLELVVDRFDQCPFPEQYRIHVLQVLFLHVLPYLGHQLYAVLEQQLRKCLRDVPLVAEELAEDVLCHGGHYLDVAVVHVALAQIEREKFATVVDDKMELEAEEPPHSGLPLLGQPFEDLVLLFPFDVADPDQGGIDVVDATGPAQAAIPQVEQQRHQYPFLAGIEPFVAYQVGEQVGQMSFYVVQVKVLEVGKMPEMEKHEDGHHLGIRKVSLPIAPVDSRSGQKRTIFQL